ncbi:carbohydrate ABC transporter permease [Natronohydrobacter thiooxidans]|uniref:carbohydrate ABC transporter permease n=1 Tax=Natronohydrobacter thiooxidans TaxID=87172 RepID=UPI0008FF1E20|nr:sugar ABC transporter permease [Natronohydrobacter thiooxidans]
MKLSQARLALLPMFVIVVVVYVGAIVWTVGISFTPSRMLPVYEFAGLDQYRALFRSSRWIISMTNMAIFAVGYIGGCLVLGYLMAIFIDQKVRAENTLRTIFLYPHAMSFIVTGLVWNWMLSPTEGIQDFVRGLGWQSFTFDWIVQPRMAIYTIVIAGVWHGAGFVMALLLAGLRGVDEEIWKAGRIDAIPRWRMYLHVVTPILAPVFATSAVLLTTHAIKSYDIVVAMTQGGPGISTEVPAKYVMDYLFERGSIGQAAAAATVMLMMVAAVAAPVLYARSFAKSRRG